MSDQISFVWPAAGAMQVIPLANGGCTVKFSFGDHANVGSIGRGRILKVHNIPTRRIAQRYEIVVRHDGGFESSYNIVDQTPHAPPSRPLDLGTPGDMVEAGELLYEIRNGGFLHFQLLRSGLLVDPRIYMRPESDRASRSG